jgi:AhpD family alkylhydroperoxidase
MPEKVKEFYNRFKVDAGKMQQALPDMMKGFQAMFAGIMKDGALDLKSKELIALAVGLAAQCKPCVYLHVQKRLDAGANREEILEAGSVVVMMRGEPAFTHIPEVMDALEALGK